MNTKERELIRRLASKYMEIAKDPVQDRRRDAWRKHQSFKGDIPLIYARRFAFHELPDAQLICEDQGLHHIEYHLRRQIYSASLNDDSVFEPWFTIAAVHSCTGWGVEVKREYSGEKGGSYKIDYAVKTLDDLDRLRVPFHGIDERKTAEHRDYYENLFGDIMPVNIDRSPWYTGFSGDLSTHLGHLRGIEHFMMDMFDNPEWLKRFMKFMADGIEKVHAEAEEKGDWGLTGHQNQSMFYCEELDDPAPDSSGKKRSDLWGYMAAQEFTGVSPDMHEEFLLTFQKPILEKFGLCAYGCCEDLTRKIGMLRSVKNLRRIAVAPVADAAKCAEQIGSDYILSYRPSPTDMVGYGFDEQRIRKILLRDLGACRANGCHTDITLKDTETVEGDPERVRKWVEITRNVIDEIYG